MLITCYKSGRRRKQKEKIKCTRKLNRISLSVFPFYRELQKIFMNDHPQVTIMVQNLIF